MTELLACPFCGNDPMPDYCSSTDGPAYLFHCQATGCPAWPSAQGETEAEAIAAWNTRPSTKDATRPTASDVEVERVAMALCVNGAGYEWHDNDLWREMWRRQARAAIAALRHDRDRDEEQENG